MTTNQKVTTQKNLPSTLRYKPTDDVLVMGDGDEFRHYETGEVVMGIETWPLRTKQYIVKLLKSRSFKTVNEDDLLCVEAEVEGGLPSFQ